MYELVYCVYTVCTVLYYKYKLKYKISEFNARAYDHDHV